MRLRLQLGHEVHDHHHDDQERGAAEVERHAELGNQDLRQEADAGDVQRAPDVRRVSTLSMYSAVCCPGRMPG